MKYFKFPQDLLWVGAFVLCVVGIVLSSIYLNWIPILISSLTFVGFFFIWFKMIFWPIYSLNKKIRLKYQGINFCYHRNFEASERVMIKMAIDDVIRKFELRQNISHVCIIDDALSGSYVFFVDDIDEKAFNAKYGTSYKKLSGYARWKTAVIEFTENLRPIIEHEVAHMILDSCSKVSGTDAQHVIIKDTLRPL